MTNVLAIILRNKNTYFIEWQQYKKNNNNNKELRIEENTAGYCCGLKDNTTMLFNTHTSVVSKYQCSYVQNIIFNNMPKPETYDFSTTNMLPKTICWGLLKSSYNFLLESNFHLISINVMVRNNIILTLYKCDYTILNFRKQNQYFKISLSFSGNTSVWTMPINYRNCVILHCDADYPCTNKTSTILKQASAVFAAMQQSVRK